LLEVSNPSVLRERYEHATPWPHLVADGIVEPDLAAAIAREVAGLPRAALAHRRSRRQVKSSSTRPRDLGPRTRALLNVLSGPELRAAAQSVTGITGLETDPDFCRAGVFVTPPGGWQRVHEDFPVHPVTGMWNRVIVLVYCSEWEPGWGGELELWPTDMSSVGRRIEPRPGRLVMFEPTSAHPHGVRTVAHAGGSRVVLASRLYSHEAPAEIPNPPLWRWRHRPDEHRRDVWPTPSEAARELRALMRRHLHERPADPGY
jgi:hypothetical protein